MSELTVAALAECEDVIQRGLDTFVEVGTALGRIRDERLYRQDFGSFEEYCRSRWGFDRTYAHRVIGAAEVVSVLPMGNRPASERQARELAPLRDEPEAMAEAMQTATAAADAEARKVTARDVRDAVAHLRTPDLPEPIPGQTAIPTPPATRREIEQHFASTSPTVAGALADRDHHATLVRVLAWCDRITATTRDLDVIDHGLSVVDRRSLESYVNSINSAVDALAAVQQVATARLSPVRSVS